MTQLELFKKIWNSRPHISEVSGKKLLPVGHSQWHWQFAHVLPKGSFPSMKHDEENIMLMLPEEHEHQERFEKFLEKKEELLSEYYKRKKLTKL